MPLQWYWIPVILFSGIFVLIVISLVVATCCHRYRRKKSLKSYKRNWETETASESLLDNTETIVEIRNTDVNQRLIGNVSSVRESRAEVSISDFDGEDMPVSAYGDSLTYNSIDHKTSWLSLNSTALSNLHIQTSLIYSAPMRYIAGKIIQVDGFTDELPALQVKVHVVILPVRKYALKTNWYDVTGTVSRLEEYFKYKFKVRPKESLTRMRMRVYGRKKDFGSFLGRPKCMGECYISLSEVVNARGGLTVWRQLSRNLHDVEIIEET